MSETQPNADLLSPLQFLRASGMKGEEVLLLLEQGLITFEKDSRGRLLLDPSGMDRALLGGSVPSGMSQDEQVILREAIAAQVLDCLEDLVREAVSLAGIWLLSGEENPEGGTARRSSTDD